MRRRLITPVDARQGQRPASRVPQPCSSARPSMRRAGPEAHPRAAHAKEWAPEPHAVTSAGAACWAKRASRVAVVRVGAEEIAGRAQLRSRMMMVRLWQEAADSTIHTGGIHDPLQIDGKAWLRRQVARFDSNTPRDDSHSLVHLSLCTLASAGRYRCSRVSTRAPQSGSRPDAACEVSSHVV